MGPSLMLKLRICHEALKPFFHQGCTANFTLRLSLCNSLQHSPSARFMCSKNGKPNTGGRQTDRSNNGQGDVKNTTKRYTEKESFHDLLERKRKTYVVRKKPDFPTSVFAAGTAKRTAELMMRKAGLASQDEEPDGRPTRGDVRMQPPDRVLSVAEWRELKESLGNPQRFDIRMMIAMFTSGVELDIAKSLLTFVITETGTLTYELLLRYLTLCVNGGHDAEVFDVYNIMQGSFPSLETSASSLFIKSFSRTARWREALSILQELKKVFNPSPRNYGDVICAAMSHGDKTTAWALYDELIEKGLIPQKETWDGLFQGVRKIEEEQGQETQAISQSKNEQRLLEILLYMRDNQLYPHQSLASTIKTWFESLVEQKWTGSWTRATPKGMCGCCGSELESIQLTTEEYQQLKDRVLTDVIQGKDVFNKTTPEELERFKEFVKKKPAFDVVIDGLNVANLKKDRKSETLLAVVSELERRGLIVLVLGRKHMLQPSRSWDRRDIKLIQQKAHCFFTENISEDDPFLLYATLHSGNHCQFVSRDLMRDHKACLSDGVTRRLFFKWQRGHQLVVGGCVAEDRRVRFLSIPSYDTIIQTSADSWHLPYDDTENRSSYEIPQRWLCLTKKH